METLANNKHGFTLIELIVVLIIMAIVSTVIISRLGNNENELLSKIEVIKSHLRYTQLRAMNDDVIWGIQFDGTSYLLFKNKNRDNVVDNDETLYFPGEDSRAINLPAEISADEIVSFDSWGRPYEDVLGQIDHAGGAIGSLSISITPNTGFIR